MVYIYIREQSSLEYWIPMMIVLERRRIYWGYTPFDSYQYIDMPDWIRFLSKNTYINNGKSKEYTIRYAISESMFTPQDLEESELIPVYRPYAGTLV